jgi:hypothetical protein
MLLFFAGLLASIPLTLGVNLLTPAVQNWLGRRSTSRATQRAESLKQELEKVHQYAAAPDKFQRFLLVQVLRIALISSIGAGATIACFAIANVIRGASIYLFTIFGYEWYTNDIFNSAGVLIGIVTAMIIIPLCLNAFKINFRVDHFADYNKEIMGVIESLNPTE